eukprot:scaffold21_cov107-Cylindrotheca_fusiformis.AAC.10
MVSLGDDSTMSANAEEPSPESPPEEPASPPEEAPLPTESPEEPPSSEVQPDEEAQPVQAMEKDNASFSSSSSSPPRSVQGNNSINLWMISNDLEGQKKRQQEETEEQDNGESRSLCSSTDKKQQQQDRADLFTLPTVATDDSSKSNSSSNSPKGKRQPRSYVPEIYCIALLAMLCFFVGLFTGRYVWEPLDVQSPDPPRTISNPPPSPPPTADAKSQDEDIPHLSVGVYYYPWHGNDFHRGDGYVRKFLQPMPQEPMLGEYDDTDPAVIGQHLEWSRRANINLWVTSWWGPNSREDSTTRTVILPHEQLGDHNIALFYETFGRIRAEYNYSMANVGPDMEHMCEHYFSHPNYLRIDGRPVLFAYLTRLLDDLGLLRDVVDLMRQAVQESCQEDVYIVGDQIFGPSSKSNESTSAFRLLDAVTNYDVYGNMANSLDIPAGGYLKEEQVDYFYQFENRQWREESQKQGCAFIPSIAPGYNDLGVRPEAQHVPLARSLQYQTEGSLFQVALKNARSLVDSQSRNLLMVNSFNEWHEDSQIEPVIGATMEMPFNLTYGIEYHGYGYLYLDILRKGTQVSEHPSN